MTKWLEIFQYLPIESQIEKDQAGLVSRFSITNTLWLPEEYDEPSSYPMVGFIADSSCAGIVPYHMTSFDYAYNGTAVMEWLYCQSK